jgi:hypothetical protein
MGIICEQVFTGRGSDHAKVACYSSRSRRVIPLRTKLITQVGLYVL